MTPISVIVTIKVGPALEIWTRPTVDLLRAQGNERAACASELLAEQVDPDLAMMRSEKFDADALKNLVAVLTQRAQKVTEETGVPFEVLVEDRRAT